MNTFTYSEIKGVRYYYRENGFQDNQIDEVGRFVTQAFEGIFELLRHIVTDIGLRSLLDSYIQFLE